MALKDIEEQLYGMKEEEEEAEEIFEEPRVEPEKTYWEKSKREVFKPPVQIPKRPPINFYQPRKKPIALYIFIGLLGIVLVIEGIVIAKKYFSRETNINISVTAPNEVLMADPFEFKVEYQNNSPNLLRNVTLILELGKDVRSLTDPADNSFIKRELGDLGTGSSNTQTFLLVALGSPNRVANFKATLQYNLPGFGSRFEKSKNYDLAIGGPALDFNIVLPQNVISGEEFVFEINYSNNTRRSLTGLKLQTFYPLGFNFTSSSIQPSEGNNLWVLGDLSAKNSGKLLIKGTIVGQIGSFYTFASQLSILVQDQLVTLEKKTAGVAIQASPLKLEILVNNVSDYIATLNEVLEYRINYQNNTPIGLEEAIIKAKIQSDLFDLSWVETNGYFDSTSRQIIWNAGNTPELRLVNRGASGSVSFKIRLKNNYPIKKLSDKNFVLKVSAQMESLSVPPATNLQRTTAVSEINTKVAGKADLIVSAFFRDAASGIVNKGTLPLQVGKGTNFTIHWKIINYSNDLSNIIIKSVLPQGVSWTGMISGNYGDSAPQYNERTSEVIWQIPKLPATAGVVLPAREVIFQIAAVPSFHQIGHYMKLLERTEFSAKDDFTGQEINFVVDSINSELKNDPTIKPDDGKVRP